MSGEQQDDKLKDFRGGEPKAGEDAAPSPPVADDDGGAPAAAAEDVVVAGVDPKKDEPAAPVAPKQSPFDAKRERIAARFSEKRKADYLETDLDPRNPVTLYGKLAGDDRSERDIDPPDEDEPEQPDPKAPAKPGPSDSGDKPEAITLVVNGKTITKTLDEVAGLSELSVEEVKADPKRAKRYAQIELAKQEGLNEVKQLRRETPSRRTDATDTRSARPDPDQDRREAGNDDRDQPPASRDTSDEELAKLIEDIQIGDPKEVGPKVKSLFETMARTAASGVVQQTEGDRLRHAELQSNVSAVSEFLKEHPDLEGKPAVAAAISGKLDEEYRTDLRTVLIQEGESEEDADRLLSQANRDQIRNAHLARRLDRNPHVRQIDKAMIENVYAKVRSDFGVTDAPQQQQQSQQNLSRQERKEALPQQPRRASVPPATPAAPPAQLSRRAVVAEMAARTGKRRSTLPR